MEEQFYGYARVSSVGQNEERQCLARLCQVSFANFFLTTRIIKI